MSWFTRTATDHERDTAPSRCFPACASARVDPVMSLSVIAARFSMRSPKLAFTVNNRGCQLTLQQYGRERADTRNNLRRHFSRLFIKYATTCSRAHCVCTVPSTIELLRSVRESVEKDLRDNYIEFGDYENHWH